MRSDRLNWVVERFPSSTWTGQDRTGHDRMRHWLDKTQPDTVSPTRGPPLSVVWSASDLRGVVDSRRRQRRLGHPSPGGQREAADGGRRFTPPDTAPVIRRQATETGGRPADTVFIWTPVTSIITARRHLHHGRSATVT